MNTSPPPYAPRWPAASAGASLGECLALAALVVVFCTGLLVWLAGQLAASLFGAGWPHTSASDAGTVLLRLPAHLGDPRTAWPLPAQSLMPGALAFYLVLALLMVVIAGVAALAIRWLPRLRSGTGRRSRDDGATWARRGELRTLLVRAPAEGRLSLGRLGGRVVACEARQSAIVIAPTQSLKTTGLAVPALLEWQGPVLATSVKTDLLRDSVARRHQLGDVLIYDPTASTGYPACGWTPLTGCNTWQGAQRVAAWLCAAARSSHASLADADFWYAAAAKLLAPILFAATAANGSIADVVRWIDTQEQPQVRQALLDRGVEEALTAAEATWARDERQRSSIYTTTETVLAAYADPGVLASAYTADLTPDRLLDGGAHTAYLCAPAHEQQRLRPLFATLVQQVVAAIYERCARTGKPLDPPLLIVLDEAANIAPLSDLDTLAATGAGQGIQLLSVFQDLAQIRERWGARALTIVNNHRAKLIGAGISDPDTLDYVARVLGEQEIRQVSQTAGHEGHASTTESSTYRALAPPHVVRQARAGTAVLIYGNLPPARIRLRPWFADHDLRALAAAQPARTAASVR